MSFRKKIILSQLLLFTLFISALFPLIEKTVGRLVRDSLEESTTDLIELIESAPSEEVMIETLKNQEYFVFFRVSLLNAKNELIYDSHLGRLFKEELPPFNIADHPEVQQALKGEVGYAIAQSKIFAGKFAYVAKAFPFQGTTYVLRTAFPFNQIQDIAKNFEIGFLLFSFVMLLFFMALTWMIFNRFSRPIRKIIDAIRPYQTGQQQDIPKIRLDINENDEFNRLAKTLNSLSDKVRTQIKMGKDFVANASHELKTPITIIKGFAETLHDTPAMTSVTLSEITGKILRNCERMETLVKNLLTLADLENISEENFKESDLALLVEDCKHIVHTLHPEAEIKIIKSDERLFLYADPDILELAILNLLNNAIKYSKPPAKITISMRNLNADEVELKMSDQGIGIAKEDLEHIFERFYTVDKARSRRLGGAGLGLSIVKAIIDKHHAFITAESILGKGTTFTIVLPKKKQI